MGIVQITWKYRVSLDYPEYTGVSKKLGNIIFNDEQRDSKFRDKYLFNELHVFIHSEYF